MELRRLRQVKGAWHERPKLPAPDGTVPVGQSVLPTQMPPDDKYIEFLQRTHDFMPEGPPLIVQRWQSGIPQLHFTGSAPAG